MKVPKMNKLPKNPDTKISEYDPRPIISFSEKELPEIKDWRVGEEYTLILKVKQTGSSSYDDSKMNASFKVIEVGVQNEEKEESGEQDQGDDMNAMNGASIKTMKDGGEVDDGDELEDAKDEEMEYLKRYPDENTGSQKRQVEQYDTAMKAAKESLPKKKEKMAKGGMVPDGTKIKPMSSPIVANPNEKGKMETISSGSKTEKHYSTDYPASGSYKKGGKIDNNKKYFGTESKDKKVSKKKKVAKKMPEPLYEV